MFVCATVTMDYLPFYILVQGEVNSLLIDSYVPVKFHITLNIFPHKVSDDGYKNAYSILNKPNLFPLKLFIFKDLIVNDKTKLYMYMYIYDFNSGYCTDIHVYMVR